VSADAEDALGPPPDKRAAGPAVKGASTVLLVLLAACLGGVVVHWIARIFEPEPEPPAEVVEVRSTPSVVVAVRDLARLETTSFHVERVIDMTSRQRTLFGLVEAEDSILLVAAADVVAGVDLADLEESDVVVDDQRVTLTLPAPEIFTTALHNESTCVYQRDTDVLARRSNTLETRARREAERTLREAAVEAGIHDRARRSARQTVGSLVRSLGYAEVEIEFADGE